MAEDTGDYSRLVEREGERLLRWLKDSDVGSIQCSGWDGIGRWRIAKYAANKAMETHLFDVLIWVDLQRKDFTPGNVQRKIAEGLRIQPPITDTHNNFTTDFETAYQIYKNLKSRNFLLVVGSSDRELDAMDLVGLGVPDVERRSHVALSSKSFSKVVWVGELSTRMKCDRYLNLTADNYWNHNSLINEFNKMFFDEVIAGVTSTMRNTRYSSPRVAPTCMVYIFLLNPFPYDPQNKWFLRFCIAERIIDGEMETEEVLLEEMDQLLEEFKQHGIILGDNLNLSQGGDLISYAFREILKDEKFVSFVDTLTSEDGVRHQWGAIENRSLGHGDYNININREAPDLSTLIIADNINKTLPPTFFQHMTDLRVLDIRSTSIESLPSSLSSLRNLRLLMLRSCHKIHSLPTSLQSLEKLVFLDLSKCTSLEMIPEESFGLMGRLQFLDLSGTRIQALPSSVSYLHNLRQLLLNECRQLTEMPVNCFEWMSCLQVLNLSNATSLKSLPSSLSNLVSLKILDLSHCTSLKTGVGLMSLQKLSSLEVLNLSECKKLEDISDVSFEHILPNLRDLKISDTPTPKRLLFRGCQSIERLDLSNLENLEVLHLFGHTKLKELKLDTPKRYCLKHLDILPIENFDKVNVFGKDEQYEVLNWGEDAVGTRIWVSYSEFFKSEAKHLGKNFKSKCFSRFYIRISPYREEQEERYMPMAMNKIQNIYLQRSRFLYKGIYCSQIHTYLFPHFTQAYGKCLEISRGDSFPTNLEGFLSHTELVILFNNNFVKRLSDLCDVTVLDDLKECQIGSCQGIETLFFSQSRENAILSSLEVIWANDLPKLTTVCNGVFDINSFKSLKRIFLQHCPKLGTLFTSAVHLERLETLEIRYCYKLEKVFGEEVEGREGSFPSLCNLYLFQVPKLKSICNGWLPSLKILQVHRCPMLRKLPIQVRESVGSTSSSPPVVEIRGELEWWNGLEWGKANENNNARLVQFRPWRHLPATTPKQH